MAYWRQLPLRTLLVITISLSIASIEGSQKKISISIPRSQTENTFCYDLIYGQKPTPFLKWAYNHGARKTADGTGMLVEQAAESFFIWRGIQPNTSKVIDMLMQQKGKIMKKWIYTLTCLGYLTPSFATQHDSFLVPGEAVCEMSFYDHALETPNFFTRTFPLRYEPKLCLSTKNK